MATKEQQLTFEGIRVDGAAFKLNAYSAHTSDKHHIGDVVGGEWKGRVVGINHEETKDGGIVREHVIMIERATIG